MHTHTHTQVAFRNLPADLYPMVTLVSVNISATLKFDWTPPPNYAQAGPARAFGEPGLPGSERGICTVPGHAELRWREGCGIFVCVCVERERESPSLYIFSTYM